MRNRSPNGFPQRQQGAVLYVALIMLIVIALLGVSAMQVATMQEKMSSNYVAAKEAFENTESVVKTAECYLAGRTNRTSTTACNVAATQVEDICETNFDATNWAKGKAMATPAADSISMRSIGKCISGQESTAMGREAERGGETNPVFQITAYAADDTANPSADASIDTIYMP